MKSRRDAVVITIAACVVVFALLLRFSVPHSRKTARAGTRTGALTWMTSPEPNALYNIYRLAGSCPEAADISAFSLLATNVKGVTYSDQGLADGSYCYGVTTAPGDTTHESAPTNLAMLELVQHTTPANPPRQLLVNELTVPWCANADLESFVSAGPCSQGPIVYEWTGLTCRSTPATLCESLTGPKAVQVKMDPEGAYTLLIGWPGAPEPWHWKVTVGQIIDIVMTGKVQGSTKNANWPHDQKVTGNGRVDEITTVLCGTDCTKAEGISHTFCDSSSCKNENDYNGGTYRLGHYDFTVEIKLQGNNGTATFRSLGTHLAP